MPTNELELSFLPDGPVTALPTRRKRIIALLISLSITVTGLLTALYVGTLGYDVRRTTMHEARLQNVLRQEPTAYQVTEGLKEKAPLLVIADNARDVERAAIAWGGDKTSVILAKSRDWSEIRVYEAGDMVYFIFFDGSAVMRDFEFVSS